MVHSMKLKQEPFESIKKGLKTIELRLNDDKRKNVRVGDEISFQAADGETLLVRVLNLYHYDSFEELYKYLPLDKCGYDDVEKADPKDMEAFYSKEEQAKFGVVGIEIVIV